ncbi:MAG: SDR family oxidoreductase [Betaproteobacteria bacterium]
MRVFLTGATSGIGEALARQYAGLGATLGLVARRAHELERVAATLQPAEVAIYPADVRDASAMAAAAADFCARFGTPDIVIANAGVSRGTLTEIPDDLPAFQAVFDTNVMGVINTFAPFAATMRHERHGTLVGVASVAGFRGLPGAGAYSASKAALITYLESLRIEFHDSGVAVVTICPGFVATPLTARNPYRMMFILQPDRAAQLMARAIARQQKFYVMPWQVAWIGRLLRVLPRWLFDPVMAGRKRKPRHVD